MTIDSTNGPVLPTDSNQFAAGSGTTRGSFASFLAAAIFWHRFGLAVIPLWPGTKKTAVQWARWLTELSPETISRYWQQHPDHEVGCIVGEGLIVFDTDSPESDAALAAIEAQFGVVSKLVFATAKGTHHYYRRPADSYANRETFSTDQHPERVDVLTGNTLAILPPSTGKSIQVRDAAHVSELTPVSQEFIDAVFVHNGGTPPRSTVSVPATASSSRDRPEATCLSSAQLAAMIGKFDPDLGRKDWRNVMMGIHHYTGASEAGFTLVNDWSAKGRKYEGSAAVRAQWDSFKTDQENPITIRTIIAMLKAMGLDWMEICSAAEPDFEPCETEIVPLMNTRRRPA